MQKREKILLIFLLVTLGALGFQRLFSFESKSERIELQAYKIENLVKELEELANTYLGELSDGRFTLEFVVSNDKLNVQVTDNGKIVDILALS